MIVVEDDVDVDQIHVDQRLFSLSPSTINDVPKNSIADSESMTASGLEDWRHLALKRYG